MLRTTRQYIEVLAPGDGLLRATRQYVEVLYKLPIESTIVDTLALTDSSWGHLEFGPLPSQAFSDTLVFAQSAGYYNGINEPIDVLNLSQVIDIRQNRYTIAQTLVFSQVAYLAQTYEQTISQSLVFSDAETLFYNHQTLIDTLVFVQRVDLNGAVDLDINQTLAFVDIGTGVWAAYVQFVGDTLALSQSFVLVHPFNEYLNQVLTLAENIAIVYPYNIAVWMPMDWQYNEQGFPWYRRESFEQTIERDLVAQRRKDEHLILTQGASVVKIVSGAINETANNILTLVDSAARVYGDVESLTFAQAVSVTVGSGLRDTLTFSQVITKSHTANHPANTLLTLAQTVRYTLINPKVLCQYNPFIGTTTDTLAPPPPRVLAPARTTYYNIQMFYPTDTPTTTLTIRRPEFGDQDRLEFSRIKQETRGGTLYVYADTLWPRTQHMLLSFTGLSEVESQAILTLIEAALGCQVGLRDWEGREWCGVLLDTDNPLTRNRRYNAMDLHFEGVPVHRVLQTDNLVFSDDADCVLI